MTKLIKSPKSGFTITELLVVIVVGTALSVVVLSISLFFFSDVMRTSMEAQLILESQKINNVALADLRVSERVLNTNMLDDDFEPSGGWNTSDPDHILIVSKPSIDTAGNFIEDTENGTLFKDNLIYFEQEGILYRRTLTDPNAVDNSSITTCPASSATSSCPADGIISEDFADMTFVFYDVNGDETTVLDEARSINIVIDVEREGYGRRAGAKNDIRVTLRNPT